MTDAGAHDADILVIALGADYDVSSTPGITLGDNEFYSVPGAMRMRQAVPAFRQGHAVIGVCGAPYKCPPAPSETARAARNSAVTCGPVAAVSSSATGAGVADGLGPFSSPSSRRSPSKRLA